MFYVVNISFFCLGAGIRKTYYLWLPEAGVREALIYFLENHCTTSGKIEL